MVAEGGRGRDPLAYSHPSFALGAVSSSPKLWEAQSAIRLTCELHEPSPRSLPRLWHCSWHH